MKTSAIGWTDYSGGDLNFVTGCTPVSEGCQNCYARAIYRRFKRDFSKVTVHPDKLQRLARKKFPEFSPKRGESHRPMCFPVDTGDLFHEDVQEEFIIEALDMMCNRVDVIWQLLTKRPERAHDLIRLGMENTGGEWFLTDNIWLGVSVSNQRTADERIPILLDTPAAVRFVSVEPMLESINLRHISELCIDKQYGNIHYCIDALSGDVTWIERRDTGAGELMGEPGPALDWVIVGAESGPNRRPFDVAWAADIKRQCDAAGVSFFGKQGSGLHPGVPLLIDGRTWHEWLEVGR